MNGLPARLEKTKAGSNGSNFPKAAGFLERGV